MCVENKWENTTTTTTTTTTNACTEKIKIIPHNTAQLITHDKVKSGVEICARAGRPLCYC